MGARGKLCLIVIILLVPGLDKDFEELLAIWQPIKQFDYQNLKKDCPKIQMYNIGIMLFEYIKYILSIV